MRLFGGIEAGGTKFNCIVAAAPDDIRAELRIPTTLPGETMKHVADFFEPYREGIAALGIGSFGPLDAHRSSPAYGSITSTPKPGWKDVNIRAMLQQRFPVPVGFDTDVNAAALGEKRWGAAQGKENFIYLTVGTGIGGGVFAGGTVVHGLIHPEMGHIYIPHERGLDPFEGVCPFHKDCLEGLATGPAMEKRWGLPAEKLPDGHPAWDLEAGYLACALVNYIAILSPELIILGGGVMQRESLFPLIRRKVRELLNGYIRTPLIVDENEDFIVSPGLGTRSGALGSLALAMEALGL
ncbi:MAG: ROK family protein [Candidatus Eremiobacteraeota bacterium]|nr:ROK family protein [Candidatus Eremiobacteraeota bacterium]